jgi:hypothetical protein
MQFRCTYAVFSAAPPSLIAGGDTSYWAGGSIRAASGRVGVRGDGLGTDTGTGQQMKEYREVQQSNGAVMSSTSAGIRSRSAAPRSCGIRWTPARSGVTSTERFNRAQRCSQSQFLKLLASH